MIYRFLDNADVFFDHLHSRIADIILYYFVNFTTACVLAGIVIILFGMILYRLNRKLDKKLKDAEKEVLKED